MIVVYLYARRQPCRIKSDAGVTFKVAMATIWKAVSSLLMIVIVVGGILTGYFTATESAAIAVVYSLVLSVIYRSLQLRELSRILVDAGRTTAAAMLLVAVSTILSFVMSFAKVTQAISDAVLGFTDPRLVVLIIMMIVLLLIGAFMDPTPAILIFFAIFLPIALEFGM